MPSFYYVVFVHVPDGETVKGAPDVTLDDAIQTRFKHCLWYQLPRARVSVNNITRDTPRPVALTDGRYEELRAQFGGQGSAA
jgi:hypothetical protein